MSRKPKKTNWQLIARKALNQERNKMSIPAEWTELSKSQIAVLQQLQDGGISISTIVDETEILKLLENGPKSFVEQCLRACMSTNDDESFETKFLFAFHLVEDAIDNERITYLTKKAVRQYVMMHSIEKDYTAFFIRFLKILNSNNDQAAETHSNHDNTDNSIPIENKICSENPEINSEVLLSACRRKNYAIIKELVSFGYR